MNEPFDSLRIRILEPALQWARAHPSFFFPDGAASAASLMEQLAAGAQALGATAVEAHAIGDGFVVAARNDWFTTARFPIPENFDFHTLTPFPEQGQNCTRPEFLVAAFAEQIVVRGPSGTRIVKGIIAPIEPMLTEVAKAPGWQRAIAFRGLAS